MPTDGLPPEADNAALYHIVHEDETVTDAADAVWSMIEDWYETTDDGKLALAIDIEGHRNDAGGFTSDFYLFQKNICVGLLTAFVDTLITPLGTVECSDTTLSDVLDADRERVAQDDGERDKTPGGIQSLDEATPSEIVANCYLFAHWDETEEDLAWGLMDDDVPRSAVAP